MNFLLNLATKEAPSQSILSVIDRPPMWVLLGLSYGYEVSCWGKGKQTELECGCVTMTSSHVHTRPFKVLNKAGLGKRDEGTAKGLPFVFLAWCSANCVSKKIKKKRKERKLDPKAFQVIIKRLQVHKVSRCSKVKLINHFITLPFMWRAKSSPPFFSGSPFSED